MYIVYMFGFMIHILIPVHILYIDWIWQGTDLSAILTSTNYRLPIQHPSLAAISDQSPRDWAKAETQVLGVSDLREERQSWRFVVVTIFKQNGVWMQHKMLHNFSKAQTCLISKETRKAFRNSTRTIACRLSLHLLVSYSICWGVKWNWLH